MFTSKKNWSCSVLLFSFTTVGFLFFLPPVLLLAVPSCFIATKLAVKFVKLPLSIPGGDEEEIQTGSQSPSADKLISFCFSISSWCPVARGCRVNGRGLLSLLSVHLFKKNKTIFLEVRKLRNVTLRAAEKAVHRRLFFLEVQIRPEMCGGECTAFATHGMKRYLFHGRRLNCQG